MNQLAAIEEDAFNAGAFQSMKKLTLSGISRWEQVELKKGIFNGLESLEVLNIRGAGNFKSIDRGILNGLNQTLKELTIERSEEISNKQDPFQLDSFTGSGPLNVEYIRIRHFVYVLRMHTFDGLKNIKHLDVSHCNISIVQHGTFDPISSSLKVLRIENNPLVTLATDIFDSLTRGYDNYIFLGDDPTVSGLIDCRCDGLPVNFVLKSCSKDFCSRILQGTQESTTSSLTLTTSTAAVTPFPSETTDTSATIDADHFKLSPKCNPNISMKTTNQTMTLQETNDSETIVLYTDGTFKENSTLLLFVTVDDDDDDKHFSGSLNMNCLNNTGAPIDVKNLKNNADYIICVVNGSDAMVSSLNCISYTNRKKPYILDVARAPKESWNDSNPFNIIIAVLAFACAIIAGLIFGVLAQRKSFMANKYIQIKS